MEVCSGGELHHTIGEHHYSERTVASYMRAVLRTLAQCHSHHILHRDIKPGVYLLEVELLRCFGLRAWYRWMASGLLPVGVFPWGLAVSYRGCLFRWVGVPLCFLANWLLGCFPVA